MSWQLVDLYTDFGVSGGWRPWVEEGIKSCAGPAGVFLVTLLILGFGRCFINDRFRLAFDGFRLLLVCLFRLL